MNIQEIDDLVNWFKRNVFDLPKEEDGIEIRLSENTSNAGKRLLRDSANLYPDRSNVEAITEYEFPINLLEQILGIEHC